MKRYVDYEQLCKLTIKKENHVSNDVLRQVDNMLVFLVSAWCYKDILYLTMLMCSMVSPEMLNPDSSW